MRWCLCHSGLNYQMASRRFKQSSIVCDNHCSSDLKWLGCVMVLLQGCNLYWSTCHTVMIFVANRKESEFVAKLQMTSYWQVQGTFWNIQRCRNATANRTRFTPFAVNRCEFQLPNSLLIFAIGWSAYCVVVAVTCFCCGLLICSKATKNNAESPESPYCQRTLICKLSGTWVSIYTVI